MIDRLRRFEVRRPGLLLVMLGALSLSFSGQRASVAPLLGWVLANVFAGTNDLAALLALNEVISGRTRSIRRWAWVVLILSGGTGLGLNTWHAIQVGVLPTLESIVVGAEPVLLAWVLSHVVALVMTHRREASETASRTAADRSSATVPTGEVAAPPVDGSGAVAGAREGARDGVPAPAQPALASAAVGASEPAGAAAGAPQREALPDAVDDLAQSLPARLIDQAEKAERQALARSDGKRGLSYREAQKRLGVRFDTARAAVDAARRRMATETVEIGTRAA